MASSATSVPWWKRALDWFNGVTPLELPSGTVRVDTATTELYRRFLPGFKELALREDDAFLYTWHARKALKESRFIHLSRTRDHVPVSAEIGPDGSCFVCLKDTAFAWTEHKTIKKAYDVSTQTIVVRSVEHFGIYDGKQVNPLYEWHRKQEKTARKDLKDCPWMLKEYLHGVFSIGESHKSVVITEHMPRDLFDTIRTDEPFSQERTDRYIRQILEQLVDIHRVGGIHRDLKSENVLVTPTDDLKIFDFGFYGDTESCSCGTVVMAAPEQASRWLYGGKRGAITQACDVWSAGLIILEIVYRDLLEPPWIMWVGKGLERESITDKEREALAREVLRQITCCNLDWLPHQEPPSPMETLLRGMLAPNPKDRWSAAQALHHFVTKVLPQPEGVSPTTRERSPESEEKKDFSSPDCCKSADPP